MVLTPQKRNRPRGEAAVLPRRPGPALRPAPGPAPPGRCAFASGVLLWAGGLRNKGLSRGRELQWADPVMWDWRREGKVLSVSRGRAGLEEPNQA